jgi:hypothetical protein
MWLDNGLRGKHPKHWTWWNLLQTDVLDRGIPWTDCILRDRKMPNDLNMQMGQSASVGLALLSAGCATLARRIPYASSAGSDCGDFGSESEILPVSGGASRLLCRRGGDVVSCVLFLLPRRGVWGRRGAICVAERAAGTGGNDGG